MALDSFLRIVVGIRKMLYNAMELVDCVNVLLDGIVLHMPDLLKKYYVMK